MKIKKVLVNLLTLSRLPMAFLVGWLIAAGQYRWAAVPFLVAAASDILDGKLARWWGAETRFGRVADHVADVVFLIPGIYLLWRFLPLELCLLFFLVQKGVIGASAWIHFRRIEVEWPNVFGRASFGSAVASATIIMLWAGTPHWRPGFHLLAISVLVVSLLLRLKSFQELYRAVRRFDG